jgi:uncharacterized protein (TIGR03437 family)
VPPLPDSSDLLDPSDDPVPDPVVYPPLPDPPDWVLGDLPPWDDFPLPPDPSDVPIESLSFNEDIPADNPLPVPDVGDPLGYDPRGIPHAAMTPAVPTVAFALPGSAPKGVIQVPGDLQQFLSGIKGNPVTAPAPAPAGFVRQGSQPSALRDLNGDGRSDSVRLTGNNVIVSLQLASGSFGNGVTYTLPTRPTNVAIADLNGDGNPDLIVTNISSANGTGPGPVNIFIGTGDGTFKAPSSIPAGDSPQSVSVADFNGDGKADLAIANVDAGTVSILLGNGDGTFRAPAAFPVDSEAVSMVAMDANGDGKVDIVTSSSVTGTISVLLGNGDGTMKPAKNSPALTGFSYLASCDMNGDGKPDLAVAYRDRHSVALMMNNGDGTFQAPAEYAIGTSPSHIAVAPVGSGFALFSMNKLAARKLVFLGRHGHFSGRKVYPMAPPNSAQAIASADLNGDGLPDLVVGGPNLLVSLAGPIGPKAPVPYSLTTQNQPNPSATSLTIGDLNGDGKADVVVADNATGQTNLGGIGVLLGKGDGTLGAEQVFSAGSHPISVATGDFNADGKLDVAVADSGDPFSGAGAGVSMLLGKGDGTFQAPVTIGAGRYPPVQIVAADLNGDRKLDLVMITNNGTAGEILLFAGKGDGTFQSPVALPGAPAGSVPMGLAVGDLSGDGTPDLTVTVTVNGSGRLVTMLGKGDGTFTAQVNNTDFGPGTPVLIDLNADGKPDLVIPHCCGLSDATYVLNNGSGGFGQEVHTTSGPAPYAATATTVNGKPAVAAIAKQEGTLVYFGRVMTPGSGGGGGQTLTNVSAASSQVTSLAPDSIASAFGARLATGTASAVNPLQSTLAGTSVAVIDPAGVSRSALLFYASAGQVNYLVPGDTALGSATVKVTAGDGTTSSGSVPINKVSPGVFVLNAAGLAAAALTRLHNGDVTFENVYQLDSTNAIVPLPIDLGPDGDQVYLTLYGTGIRAAGTAGVALTVGGVSTAVSYAGPQGTFGGLDQVNVLLPRSLAGRGDVVLALSAQGTAANSAHLTMK